MSRLSEYVISECTRRGITGPDSLHDYLQRHGANISVNTLASFWRSGKPLGPRNRQRLLHCLRISELQATALEDPASLQRPLKD